MQRNSSLDFRMVFVLLATLSVVFWWHDLEATFALAAADDAYTHILLILPLGVTLIFLDRKAAVPKNVGSSAAASRASLRCGSILLASAALTGIYVRWWMPSLPQDTRLSLSILTLVIWWLASVLFCFGFKAFRSLLLPLGFLFFLIPLPEFMLSVIVTWLQHSSAFMAALLFGAVGEPVQRDGIFLFLARPALNIEVAKECSSIRSSCLLLITTIVLAHVFLRSGWRKLVLVLSAIPLSIVKNGLRIFVIAELGTRVDRGLLDGRFHHHGGILFFFVALGAILTILYSLHKSEAGEVVETALPALHPLSSR